MNKEPKDTTTIQDLLDVIHWTIIDHKGENNIILHELTLIDNKIKSGNLENYPLQGVAFWESIKYNNFPHSPKGKVKIALVKGVAIGLAIAMFVFIVLGI